MLKQSAAVFLSVILLSLAACGGGSAGPKNSSHTLTVGLVTDKGGLNDKSFNHLAGLGLLDAERNLSANPQCAPSFVPTCGVLQSHVASDYTTNLTRFSIEHGRSSSPWASSWSRRFTRSPSSIPKQKFADRRRSAVQGQYPGQLAECCGSLFQAGAIRLSRRRGGRAPREEAPRSHRRRQRQTPTT